MQYQGLAHRLKVLAQQARQQSKPDPTVPSNHSSSNSVEQEGHVLPIQNDSPSKIPLYMDITNPKQKPSLPPKRHYPSPTINKCQPSILEESESEEESLSPIPYYQTQSPDTTPYKQLQPLNFHLTSHSKSPQPPPQPPAANQSMKLQYTPSPFNPSNSNVLLNVQWSQPQSTPPLRRVLNFDESPPTPARLTFNETPVRSSAHHYLAGQQQDIYHHSEVEEVMTPSRYTDERLKRQMMSLQIDRQLQILNQTRQVATEPRNLSKSKQKVQFVPTHKTQIYVNPIQSHHITPQSHNLRHTQKTLSSHKHTPLHLKFQQQTQHLTSPSERKLMITKLIDSIQIHPNTQQVYDWYSQHEQQVNKSYLQIYRCKQLLACYNPQELAEKIERMIYCMIEPKRWQMLLQDQAQAQSKTLRQRTMTH